MGSHRGKNTIHILTYENMKVVHMGDIGCMIDDLSKIKNCDVLMIPIGGYYTIDTKEALEYNNQIQPRMLYQCIIVVEIWVMMFYQPMKSL